MSATLYSAVCRLHDETFDPGTLSAYNLYLSLSAAGIRVGVADVRRNKFVALEDYAVSQSQPLPAQLQALALQHDWLPQPGWNRVRLAVQNRAFTLLPSPLFRPGDEATYLRLHHSLNPAQETLHHYVHPGQEMVSLFAAPRETTDWLGATHPTAKLVHQTSALLTGVLHQSEASSPRRLYLSIGTQEFTVVVTRQKRIEFCNVFAFATPEDLIYYTILVMQELQLDPDQDPVTVWGDLMHDSELFTILRKYIRNVRFGNRPFDLAYSYRLNDVFEYRYLELFALHLCE